MLSHTLRIAVRLFARQSRFYLINLAGLTVGLAATLFIGLFVWQEWSTNRFFEQGGQVFRLVLQQDMGSEGARKAAMLSYEIGEELAGKVPEVVSWVRFRPLFGNSKLVYGEKTIGETGVVLAEPHFLEIVQFPLQQGASQQVLQQPNTVVLSAKLAKELFDGQDPVGKTITVEDYGQMPLLVTGVLAEQPRSYLNVGALVAWESAMPNGRKINEYYQLSLFIYAKLADPAQATAAEGKLNQVFRSLHTDAAPLDRLLLQPFTEAYLHGEDVQFSENERSGNYQSIWILSLVAIFILLSATINYVNLSTAKATLRAKEVGVRKAMGARKQQLVGQFLSEAAVLTFGSAFLSYLLVRVSLPLFADWAQVSLDESLLHSTPTWLLLGGLSLFTTLAAGLYPAFILANYQPIEVLKSAIYLKVSGSQLRQVLTAFHLVVSVALLGAVVSILRQTIFLTNRPLGFDQEQVALLYIDGAKGIQQQLGAFQQELMQIPGVEQVSLATDNLGSGYTNNSGPLPIEGREEKLMTTIFMVDPAFAPTYGLKLEQGRFFSGENASDSSGLVINETFAQQAGWAQPIGQTLSPFGPEGPTFTVIGVVKDFHFQALHHRVNPAAFLLTGNNFWVTAVRFDREQIGSILPAMESVWKKLENKRTFQYSFVDDEFARFYTAEQRLFHIILLFSFISLFITCLGLYALTAFSTERRAKEIGIRKVLGAPVGNIVGLFSLAHLRLLLVSSAIAIPLTHYFMHEWLQRFAFHIELTWYWYLAPLLLIMIISLTTVGWQSYRAATVNPVKSLRSE